MSVKTVCDLCGKDAIEGEFVLPKYDDWVAKRDGRTIFKIRAGVKPFKANLCPEHVVLIANYVDQFNKR